MLRFGTSRPRLTELAQNFASPQPAEVTVFAQMMGEADRASLEFRFPTPPSPYSRLDGCYAGYELVATVTPPGLTGPVTIKRYVNSESCWVGSNPQFTIAGVDSCSFGPPPYDDTGFNVSTNPSKNPKGQVFNLDAVGFYPFEGVNNPPYRHRVNFETYTVGPDGIKISQTIKFYVRLSCQTNSKGVGVFSQDVSGDNILGTGVTPLTWNLQPKLCTPETVLRWDRPDASVRPNDVRLQVIENTGQSVHRILCIEV
jgi:hypothetical protein